MLVRSLPHERVHAAAKGTRERGRMATEPRECAQREDDADNSGGI